MTSISRADAGSEAVAVLQSGRPRSRKVCPAMGDASGNAVREAERPVHKLSFVARDPLSHCTRALDVVRQMGFRLVAVSAIQATDQTFAVSVSFIQAGALPAQLLASRVAAFVGVADVQLQLPRASGLQMRSTS